MQRCFFVIVLICRCLMVLMHLSVLLVIWLLENTAFLEVHRTSIFDIKSAAEVRSDSNVDVFVGNHSLSSIEEMDGFH